MLKTKSTNMPVGSDSCFMGFVVNTGVLVKIVASYNF